MNTHWNRKRRAKDSAKELIVCIQMALQVATTSRMRAHIRLSTRRRQGRPVLCLNYVGKLGKSRGRVQHRENGGWWYEKRSAHESTRGYGLKSEAKAGRQKAASLTPMSIEHKKQGDGKRDEVVPQRDPCHCNWRKLLAREKRPLCMRYGKGNRTISLRVKSVLTLKLLFCASFSSFVILLPSCFFLLYMSSKVGTKQQQKKEGDVESPRYRTNCHTDQI